MRWPWVSRRRYVAVVKQLAQSQGAFELCKYKVEHAEGELALVRAALEKSEEERRRLVDVVVSTALTPQPAQQPVEKEVPASSEPRQLSGLEVVNRAMTHRNKRANK